MIKLSSGRVVDANRDIVGICPRLETTGGWDEGLVQCRASEFGEDDPWTAEEKRELAMIMIERWRRFKTEAEDDRPI